MNLSDRWPGADPRGGSLFPTFDLEAWLGKELAPRIDARSADHLSFVLAGQRVARSLGVVQPYLKPAAVCFWRFSNRLFPAVVIPHPSGVNRYWNDPAAKELAARSLKAFVGANLLRMAKLKLPKSKVEVVSAHELLEHPKNARRGDESAIAESIRANGFYGSLVVQRSTKYILAGNHRFRVAVRDFGVSEFPVVWFDGSQEAAMRVLYADNRTGDLASYDEEALLAGLREVEALGPDALAGTGFDAKDLEKIEASLRPPPPPDEFPPPAPTEFVKTCPACGHKFS